MKEAASIALLCPWRISSTPNSARWSSAQAIDQFTMVLVSVYDDPNANEKWCQGHRKLASAKHPFTGESTRYLSVAVPVAPAEVVAATPSELQRLVAAAIERALAARPSRLPKGLDYAALRTAVGSVLS